MDNRIEESESPFYNGKLFRGTDVSFEYSDEQIQEALKCKDILYFISKIPSVNLSDKQKSIISSDENNAHLILRSRSSGMSMLIALKALHRIFIHKGDILISGEIRFIQRIIDYYKELPFYLKPQIKKISENKIIFAEYSITIIKPGDFSFIIDRRADIVYMDDPVNLGVIKSHIKVFTARSRAELLISSLPNPSFKDLYTYSREESQTDITCDIINWRETNYYMSEKTILDIINNIGYDNFLVEYENVFKNSREYKIAMLLNKQ